jgi:phosphatidate phosphatase APP1
VLVSVLVLASVAEGNITSNRAERAHTELVVISDIDDTIKDTHVTLFRTQLKNPLILFDGLHPWHPIPGMAHLYQQWRAVFSAHFFYVSEGPIRYERRLQTVLPKWGFPAGQLLLRGGINPVAPRHYKFRVLSPMIADHPSWRLFLVGDSGENDPENYGALARIYPHQIAAVFIRQITRESRTSGRYREAFRDVPQFRWHLFRDPSEIAWSHLPRVSR